MNPALKFSLLAAALALAACSGPAEPPSAPPAPPSEPAPPPAPAPAPAASARATLAPTEGNSAGGTLTFTAEAGGVRIAGTLGGLPAGSTHGFHLHETGDCSAPDASSAGPHFNPHGAAHGRPGQGEHHAGDIPNLVAGDDGSVAVDVLVSGVTLGDGGATDIAKRAIVVHAAADDYTSQPAGNSGARIACGVIE